MRHSMKPDLRDDYKIRLYTRPKNPFFEVSRLLYSAGSPTLRDHCMIVAGDSK